MYLYPKKDLGVHLSTVLWKNELHYLSHPLFHLYSLLYNIPNNAYNKTGFYTLKNSYQKAFLSLTLLWGVICKLITFFTTYKTIFELKWCLKKNPRCVAKSVITMALIFKFAFSILLICKIKLVLLVFVKIALLHNFIDRFIVDDKIVSIINNAKNVK